MGLINTNLADQNKLGHIMSDQGGLGFFGSCQFQSFSSFFC